MNKNKKYFVYIATTIFIIIVLCWIKRQIETRKKIYLKNLTDCNQIIDQLNREIRELKTRELQLMEYKTYLDKCNLIKRSQTKWSKILNQLAHNVPRTIWLEKFYVKQKTNQFQFINIGRKENPNFPNNSYGFVLVGKAIHPKSIENFNTALNTLQGIRNISVQTLSYRNLLWQFRMTGNIN